MDRIWIAVAALSGAAAVAADAVARHVLAGDPARADLVATGARYGLVHAAALLAAALLWQRTPGGAARLLLALGGWCFVAALALFSGTLYLLAAAASPAVTPLVPVGGVLFIAGWVALLCWALVPRRGA
jgi:uncharacterized membrane protein YgdD (TMEM256/DUF423 family)